MAAISEVKNIWGTLTEVDLAPIRKEALGGVSIALLGETGSGRGAVAKQMRRDPNHVEMVTQSPVMLSSPGDYSQVLGADLVIVIINAEEGKFSRYRQIAEQLIENGQNLLVFINYYYNVGAEADFEVWSDWEVRRIVYGDVTNSDILLESFVPAVMELLSGHLLSLARDFPLFRVPVANHLINETCTTNAAYSLGTGMAEMVPAFGLPLTVADIFVLTKMQAYLVYKLGLALGYSTRWQDYVAEFGGVLGGGFLWRQIARSLVGLVPGIGIIPKVAVTYAGTYVVGHVVLRWYLSGRHVSRAEMKALYKDALERGKQAAQKLAEKRPRLRKGKQLIVKDE